MSDTSEDVAQNAQRDTGDVMGDDLPADRQAATSPEDRPQLFEPASVPDPGDGQGNEQGNEQGAGNETSQTPEAQAGHRLVPTGDSPLSETPANGVGEARATQAQSAHAPADAPEQDAAGPDASDDELTASAVATPAADSTEEADAGAARHAGSPDAPTPGAAPAREDLAWTPPSQHDHEDTSAATGEPEASRSPEQTQGGPAGVAETEAWVATATAALGEVSAQLADLTAAVAPLTQLQTSVAELRRLRANDIDIIDRLHADNTKLRAGELTTAMAPLLHGLVRLHDNMTSIAAGDSHSVAGMLRTQLVQLLEVAAGVSVYEPQPGEKFDPTRHTGVARVPTGDAAVDGTIARRLRPGFTRADGSILRVAEVEVLRYTAPAPTSTDQN